MFRRIGSTSLVIISFLVLQVTFNSDCSAQCLDCGAWGVDCSIQTCIDTIRSCVSPRCPLQAFGINAQIVKYSAGTFYVRISTGGVGQVNTIQTAISIGYRGSPGSITGLVGGAGPDLGQPCLCKTAFGNCVTTCAEPHGTLVTLIPGVLNQLNIQESWANEGPSISFVLDSTKVQEVDTGMLGSSTCHVRPSTEKGEPINIASGNVYRNEVDATINSGKIGGFSFERNYNSLNQELSSFGYGWQHNFNIKVLGSSTLQEGDGRRVPFYFLFADLNQGLQIFGSPPGISDSLFQTVQFPPIFSLKKRNGTNFLFTTATANPPKHISQITDRNGNGNAFIYTDGKLTRVTESGGRYFDLVYTGNQIFQLKNQTGAVLATYEYYTGTHVNHLKRVTYGDNSWVEYIYDSLATAPHKLKKVVTSDTNQYFYEYDSMGRAKASYQTGNIDRIDVTYERNISTGPDGDSLIAKVTNQLGNIDSLVSVPNALATDRLLSKGSISGCATCADDYRYDDHADLIRKKSPLGVVDKMSYDKDERLATRIDAESTATAPSFARTYGFDYSNFDLVSRDSTKSIVDPAKFLKKVYNYDANGNLLTLTEIGQITIDSSYSDVTTFTYNSSGQVLTVDGPRTGVNDLTRFVYNGTTGDLQEVREYIGSDSLVTKSTSYDAFGNVLTVIAPNGDSTKYQYDKRQRVEKIVHRKGSGSTVVDSTLYQYNFAGNITLITLPLGNTIKYGYDLAGRLMSIVNGIGDSILYTYDLMSNRKSERVRKGSTLYKSTYYSYDSRSRLTQVCVGDSSDASKFDCTNFEYDDVGNRVKQISGNGDSTRFIYDALNRLDTVKQYSGTVEHRTTYEYDLQDNLRSVTDPENIQTTYKYSDRGHLIEEVSPASGTTTYKYDQAGNLITKIPMTGNTDSISYVYDALNRQTQIKLGGTSAYSFDYDASATNNRKGRLWRETGPIATRKFSYDYAGRVTAESVITASRTYRMAYTWDANGNQKTLTYPDGRIVTYTYDLADRVYRVVSTKNSKNRVGFDSAYYLPFGADTVRRLGNGIRVRKFFDRRGYTDSIKTSTSGIFGRRYTYDHNGNITQLLDLIDNTKSYHTITYDGIDRLLTAFGDFRTDDLTYSYLKNGNRLTKQKGTAVTTYNYTNNRLVNTTGAEAVTYHYNANGSVDTIGSVAYRYDKLNRITSITGLGNPDSFTYDGENKRIYSDENATELINLYDIYGNLISQYSPGSAFFTTDYVWANGEPRMRIDTLTSLGLGPLAPGGPTETPYWYHTDHLGTPYVLTDTLKAIQWQISLDPFGETVSENTTVISDNLRFPGQYADRGSLLNYNWNRYYQPKIGRYYQVDPDRSFGISDDGDKASQQIFVPTNIYSYALSAPLSFTDPNGTRVILAPKGKYYKPDYPRFLVLVKLYCMNFFLGPDRDIIITDGTRTPEQNKRLRDILGKGEVALHSSHLTGDAVDIAIPQKFDENDLFCAAKKCGFPASTFRYADGHYHLDLNQKQVRRNALTGCVCK